MQKTRLFHEVDIILNTQHHLTSGKEKSQHQTIQNNDYKRKSLLGRI